MCTYVVMALAVALLAGLTGGMPGPILRPRRAGSAPSDSPQEGMAAGASPKIDNVEPPLPPANEVVQVAERRRLLEEIVHCLMQGGRFIALTGMPGAGKTVMAAAISEELCRRSVNVRWIDGADGSGIPLRVIMSRVLGKPETDIGPEDIEQLFDTMMDRGAGEDRLTLIIDDAERLLPDAIGYLRLLASVAIERMPQIVFVGDPSFWDIADRTAGFQELITARFELGLLSREETRTAASQLGSLPNAGLDRQVSQEAVQHNGGPGRLRGSLVAAIKCWSRATAANLEGRSAASPPDEQRPDATVGNADTAHFVLNQPRRSRSFARMAGVAAMIVGVIAMPTHWLASLSVMPMSSEDLFARPSAVDSAPVMVVRLSPSVQTPDLSDPESSDGGLFTAIAVGPDIAEPPHSPGRQIDPAIAAHKRVTRAIAVQRQQPFTGYVAQPPVGTWLFQANPNSGANS